MQKSILFGCPCVKAIRDWFANKGYNIIQPQNAFVKMAQECIDKEIDMYLKQFAVEYVFSFGFSPNIATVCYQKNIEYVSWVWDCPHPHLWAKAARYSTNYIFLFDYNQYLYQKERGLENCYYLPLATDIDWFDQIIMNDGGNNQNKYGGDVSFLGNFYNGQGHDLYDQIAYLPPYLSGYLDAVMNAQKTIWGADLLESTLTNDIWKLIRQHVVWDMETEYEDGFYESSIKNMISEKIAQLERKELCSFITKHFDLKVYTDSDTSFDEQIRNCGHADYLSEMPLIFHYSKINIHTSVRSITSGIPLRVVDVLASGGFLLTNYQAEIEQYFIDGEELVIYTDFQDLYNKINHYLKHEDERKRIAKAGYKKVRQLFSYDNQLTKLLNYIKH